MPMMIMIQMVMMMVYQWSTRHGVWIRRWIMGVRGLHVALSHLDSTVRII